MGTWNAYGNEDWPADYLIDATATSATRPSARATTQDRNGDPGAARRSRLQSRRQEPPDRRGRPLRSGHPRDLSRDQPRAKAGSTPHSGLHDYGGPPTGELALNEFAYSGSWKIAGQPAEAVSNAAIDVEFEAKHVYLVLSSPGERPLPVKVLLDGRPISAADAGSDVQTAWSPSGASAVFAGLAPRDEQRRLSLRFAPGVTGYAFTFGCSTRRAPRLQ